MGNSPLDIMLRPAITGGVLDSVNPGSMASWLLLLIVMLLAAKRYGTMAPYGILFVVGVFSARSIIIPGFLDRWLLSRWFEVLLEVWYFIFSLACLVMGGLFWRDWRLSKKSAFAGESVLSYKRLFDAGEIPPPTPFLKREKKWRWLFFVTLRGVVSLFLGWLAALLASAWPEDGYFIVMLLSWGSAQNFSKVFAMVECYAFFYVLPLILVFLLTVVIFGGKNAAASLRARFSWVQISAAALFLGYGISFLSYYLN